jgi:hypothetical protein
MPTSGPAGQLRVALDLFETGVALMRENLRRQYPHAGDEELARRLSEWLQHRPGAEAGDANGRLVSPQSRFE